MTISLRPSLAPVAKICPSAMYQVPGRPEIRPVAQVGFSATGTALHAVFKDRIYPVQTITDADLSPYVERYNVELEGYYGIGWRARRVAEKWAPLAGFYQGAKLEQTITATLSNGFVLTGTPDLWNVFSEFGVVFDLKTGEKDLDAIPQVELYALILHKRFAALGVKEWYVAQFNPLLDKYTNIKITAAQLDELERFWVAHQERAGISYAIGPMCAYCPRMTSCPAMLKSIDPLAAELRADREVSPYDIAKFRPSILVMKKIVEMFEVAQKALLERHGIIDLGDGYELYMKEDFQDKLKPLESWKILTAEPFNIPAESILAELSMPKGAVKEAVRAIAVPRHREKGLGVMQKKVLDTLAASGAIEKVPRKEVSIRPKAITTQKEIV